jgi:hypothetical protein
MRIPMGGIDPLRTLMIIQTRLGSPKAEFWALTEAMAVISEADQKNFSEEAMLRVAELIKISLASSYERGPDGVVSIKESEE